MFRINYLLIEVVTEQGLFGNRIAFSPDLNIIHGDNSSGKSTCINAILYGLGLEELVGGKKEKTMKPVLRDELEYQKKIYKVLESNVYLEIENSNEEIVTVRRSVKSDNRDANLVTVYFGPKLSAPDGYYKSQDMYVHSSGSSTNALGFHSFLEKFLGWNLPFVPAYKGEDRKLYLQTLFPAFVIEQVRGWSDFLATVPTYYGIKNVTKRAIEFLLDLDVIQNEKERLRIASQKQSISTAWSNLIQNIERLGDRTNVEISGLPRKPEILTHDQLNGLLFVQDKNGSISLQEYKDRLVAELTVLSMEETPRAGEEINENRKRLEEFMDQLNSYEFEYRDLKHTQKLEQDNLRSLQQQLSIIEEDLVKNKDVQKIMKLGSDMELMLSKDICPTCHQHIKESLLPQSINQEPMNIGENIKFLEGQKRMVGLAIAVSKDLITRYESRIDFIKKEINDLRTVIRSLKREMVSDDRLPSQAQIERRIKLQHEVNFLEQIEKEFDDLINDIKQLSSRWKEVLADESKLPEEYFSEADQLKLKKLEEYFRQYVTKFGYKSKPTDKIEISEDKYFPTVNGFDMKFDASASDHIRAIWAYTLALYSVSNDFGGNHPNLIVFDEPGQHQIDFNHLKEFLETLHQTKGRHQFIVATSFPKKDFGNVIRNIDFNYIPFEEKSILPAD